VSALGAERLGLLLVDPRLPGRGLAGGPSPGLKKAIRRCRSAAGLWCAVQYRDFASGRTTEIYRKDGPFVHEWLAISPGEEWILFLEGPTWNYELTLVENFR